MVGQRTLNPFILGSNPSSAANSPIVDFCDSLDYNNALCHLKDEFRN